MPHDNGSCEQKIFVTKCNMRADESQAHHCYVLKKEEDVKYTASTDTAGHVLAGESSKVAEDLPVF